MAKNDPTPDPAAPVRVRVLAAMRIGATDCAVNAVVELPADEVAGLAAQGLVDADPAAVAYADSLA